jgi:hypothetical protein
MKLFVILWHSVIFPFLSQDCASEEGTCQVTVWPSIQRGGQDLVDPINWMPRHPLE